MSSYERGIATTVSFWITAAITAVALGMMLRDLVINIRERR